MTDEEIIKANDILDKFDFFNQKAGRELWNEKTAAVQDEDVRDREKDIKFLKDFINRQKSEIERLKECPKCVYEYDGEITEYCVQGPCSNFKTVEQIKAEAYKEFAKEVKEEIKEAYNNNSSVMREHLEKHKEKPNFEFVTAVQGKINTLLGLDDFIDNLLKEMVGEVE